jgi:hypothetical protein
MKTCQLHDGLSARRKTINLNAPDLSLTKLFISIIILTGILFIPITTTAQQREVSGEKTKTESAQSLHNVKQLTMDQERQANASVKKDVVDIKPTLRMPLVLKPQAYDSLQYPNFLSLDYLNNSTAARPPYRQKSLKEEKNYISTME